MLKSLVQLTRLPLALLTTASAATGWVLARGGFGAGIAVPVAGVFLLACGATALNQVQERAADALMERTRRRPIPSGDISPIAGGGIAALFLSAGLAVLAIWGGGTLPAALGAFSIVWYNGLYTPLKRYTAFASVPGGLVGAVPPAIGWVTGGGTPLDAPLLILMAFFFFWQVPHFWVLSMMYEHEYRTAGYPVLADRFPPAVLYRLLLLWGAAAIGTCILMPMYGLMRNAGLYFSLSTAGLVFLAALALFARPPFDGTRLRRAFGAVNLFAVAVMALLLIEIGVSPA
jgi:protoheme IX farnesyltransferase